jgi:uncharacterized protein (DUF3820 family)
VHLDVLSSASLFRSPSSPEDYARAHTRQTFKRIQDVGPTGELVLQFGQYKGRTLAAVAQTDADYLRWLSQKAQRPQVREAARQLLASLTATPRRAVP